MLYLTSLGVTLTGIFAYYSVVESNILRISSLIFILNGYHLSFLLRENKHRRIYSSFFTTSILILLIIDVFKGRGLLLFPPEAGGEPGLVVGNFLLWLVVLRSYTLFSPGYLLFSIIPSVAFLGLLSAYSVDPELFVFASFCFLFSILLLCFSAYDIGNFPSLRSSLFLFGLVLFLISAVLALVLLFPLLSLSSVVPVPQVYVHLGSLFRQELLANLPFLPNALLLGGGLPRGEDIILKIKGEGPVLLRAGTYDYFTGRYWVKTLFGFTILRNEKNKFIISPPDTSNPQERWEIYPQSDLSLLLPPLGYPTPFLTLGRRLNLLTPPHPCEIRFSSDVPPAYLVKGADNSLSAVFYRRGEISYEVISKPHKPLRETFVYPIYLQKPPSVRIGELARTLTASHKNDYDKALAIQSYLQSNYSYSLTASPPPQDNGVEWFLFKRKKGDCDFFASAMCILLREAGIPSRVVVGYLAGEYDAEEGVWVVRQKDAHMWVEAYIKGKGWMTFDPTPQASSTLQEFLLSLQRYYQLHKREIVPLVFFFFSVSLLFLLLRISLREMVEKRKRGVTSRERLVLLYLSFCKKLAKMGLPHRRSYNTLREWFQTIAPLLLSPFRENLEEVTDVCEEACYSRATDEERIRRALDEIKKLKKVKKWQVLKTSTS